MSSLTSLAGSDGCANNTSGLVATLAMGVKSLVMSNGTDLCSHFDSTTELSISSSV
jgi:hypothetical protein